MPPEERPKYTVYRSRPRLFRRNADDGARASIDDLREEIPRPQDRPYTVHRSGDGRRPRLPGLPGRRPKLPSGPRRPITLGRVVKWLAAAALGWILLSAVLFLISAQIQRQDVSDAAGTALDDAGYPLTSPNTILILGSDARTEETNEPGSRIGGPSRSDSILLMRAGGGASARMSIPRDTVVDIPGHGRDKINAAYAIGGAELTITTIKQYLGIEINHLVEVSFENFPQFIDALGGIDVRTGCVVSRINGGNRNGGYTLRLRAGENHINGKQALALARTRKNDCNPRENDLTRARRQQKLLSAIKSRALSPVTFARLPWVSWQAPKAVKSDMAGPSLLGLFGAMATGGTPETRVLGRVQPDGGVAVSEEEKQAEVQRFLRG